MVTARSARWNHGVFTRHPRSGNPRHPTYPWLLVAATLPLSALFFYNVVLAVVFSVLGFSDPLPHPQHLLNDIWMQLVYPCPIAVSSEMREALLSSATAGLQSTLSSYNSLLTRPLVIHKNMFQVSGTLPIPHDLDNTCFFDNWLTNKTEAFSSDVHLPGINAAFLDLGRPCVAGRFWCEEKIVLSEVLRRRYVQTGAVDAIVVAAEPVGLTPASLTPSSSSGAIYVQIRNSLVLFCVQRKDRKSVAVYSLDAGDAMRLDYNSCSAVIVQGKNDLSVGVLIEVN